jgi:hypothetical protein
MLPRQALPRQFYLVTRRCTQRQFLLRPDPETNNGPGEIGERQALGFDAALALGGSVRPPRADLSRKKLARE